MASDITKARNFTFIIYPESIPRDWEDCLSKLDIPMAISPLHDMDEKKDESKWQSTDIVRNGKHYKKSHYHVLYIARNPVTIESVRKKIKRALGDKSISHIEIADSVANVYKYLTHESADAIKKKKHKYERKDIILLNDFDIDRYVTLDESQKRDLRFRLLEIVRKNKLVNYADLLVFIEVRGEEYGITNTKDVIDVISSNTGIFRLAWDANFQLGYKSKYASAIDTETGEIVK